MSAHRAPHEGHTAALYLAGAEVVGLAWYLLYLRRRITAQAAGVYRIEPVATPPPTKPPSRSNRGSMIMKTS